MVMFLKYSMLSFTIAFIQVQTHFLYSCSLRSLLADSFSLLMMCLIISSYSSWNWRIWFQARRQGDYDRNQERPLVFQEVHNEVRVLIILRQVIFYLARLITNCLMVCCSILLNLQVLALTCPLQSICELELSLFCEKFVIQFDSLSFQPSALLLFNGTIYFKPLLSINKPLLSINKSLLSINHFLLSQPLIRIAFSASVCFNCAFYLVILSSQACNSQFSFLKVSNSFSKKLSLEFILPNSTTLPLDVFSCVVSLIFLFDLFLDTYRYSPALSAYVPFLFKFTLELLLLSLFFIQILFLQSELMSEDSLPSRLLDRCLFLQEVSPGLLLINGQP